MKRFIIEVSEEDLMKWRKCMIKEGIIEEETSDQIAIEMILLMGEFENARVMEE